MYFPKLYTNQHSMAILRASDASAFDEYAATPTTLNQKTEWSRGYLARTVIVNRAQRPGGAGWMSSARVRTKSASDEATRSGAASAAAAMLKAPEGGFGELQ